MDTFHVDAHSLHLLSFMPFILKLLKIPASLNCRLLLGHPSEGQTPAADRLDDRFDLNSALSNAVFSFDHKASKDRILFGNRRIGLV